MKFGEYLVKHMTSEWKFQYFDYELGKKKLAQVSPLFSKTAANETDRLNESEIVTQFERDFFVFVESELDKIVAFFQDRLNEAKRKLEELRQHLESYLEYERRKRDSDFDVFAYFSAGVAKGDITIHDFELAYSEYYLSLILLQNYREVNITAFRKILKKHDKNLATTRGAEWRRQHLLNSFLVTCQDIDELLLDAEEDVINKLESGDRKKAMERLKVPPLGQPRHTVWAVCRIGLWIGAFIVLVVGISLLVPRSICEPGEIGCWQDTCAASNFSDPLLGTEDGEDKFWEITIRLYRGVFLFALMILLLGFNFHGWAANGVNHVLIFELDPRHHLSSIHLIEVGLALTSITCVSLAFWLMQFYVAYVFEFDTVGLRYTALAYLLLVIAFFLNPLPVLMHKSRRWVLIRLFKIITAPFHKVAFADFWLADQLTSIVPVFQDFLFIICCCVQQFVPIKMDEICDRQLYVIYSCVGALPAWFRFMQCLRRWFDSRKAHPHLTNAAKYSCTFVVILFRTLNTLWDRGAIGPTGDPDSVNPFFYLWIASGVISALYSFAWDVRMDWGLFDANASRRNRFLRETLIYSKRAFYYSAIVIDLILRFAWTLTVADFELGSKQYENDIFITSLTFLEMLRRCMWNFFRLENEHLNNVSDFRAVRDINIKLEVEAGLVPESAPPRETISGRQSVFGAHPSALAKRRVSHSAIDSYRKSETTGEDADVLPPLPRKSLFLTAPRHSVSLERQVSHSANESFTTHF